MQECAQVCSILCRRVLKCADVHKNVQACPKMWKRVQKFPRSNTNGRACAKGYNAVFLKKCAVCVAVCNCVCLWAVQSLMDATALISAPATYITLLNEIIFKSSIFNQLLCHSFFFFRLCCCWKLSFGDTVVCQLVLGCFLQQEHQAEAWYGAVTRWCNTVLPRAPSGDHKVYPQNAPP